MTSHPQDVQQLLARYGAAWNGHDLDATMAEHTPDSVFQLNAGEPEAVGIAAVRETFAATEAA
jgi:ketosteroid isomerase-like protein